MKLRRQKKVLAAFTLLELLVVIAIMGILAAIAVPALKNVSKGHAAAAASRQLLDDMARARQLAIAHHTTVYMVFIPLNFWNDSSYVGNQAAWTALTSGATGNVELEKARALVDRQAAAYIFLSLRSVGDQPGRNNIQLLSEWRTLPEGTFIAADKFKDPALAASVYTIADPVSGASFQIYPFQTTFLSGKYFPFPSQESPLSVATPFILPYIAFNYLGQLESGRDEFIPLARGSVGYGRDGGKKPQFTGTSTASESPAGNSTNTYTLVHIDRITGRARIEQAQVR